MNIAFLNIPRLSLPERTKKKYDIILFWKLILLDERTDKMFKLSNFLLLTLACLLIIRIPETYCRSRWLSQNHRKSMKLAKVLFPDPMPFGYVAISLDDEHFWRDFDFTIWSGEIRGLSSFQNVSLTEHPVRWRWGPTQPTPFLVLAASFEHLEISGEYGISHGGSTNLNMYQRKDITPMWGQLNVPLTGVTLRTLLETNSSSTGAVSIVNEEGATLSVEKGSARLLRANFLGGKGTPVEKGEQPVWPIPDDEFQEFLDSIWDELRRQLGDKVNKETLSQGGLTLKDVENFVTVSSRRVLKM